MTAPVQDWLVYFLRCADGTLYCGVTNDLERRLQAHARGGVKYTRGRLPIDAVFIHAGFDRSSALRCEHAYKRLTRRQKEAWVATAGCAELAPDFPLPRPAPARRR